MMFFKETHFQNSMVGKIPEDWQVLKLGDVAETLTDYVANGSFASLRVNVQYRREEDYAILLRVLDFSNDFKGPFIYISEHAYNFLSKSKLKPNDIILGNVGAIGTVFRVPNLGRPMSLGPNAILVKTGAHDDYFYYWLQSERGQHALWSIATKTAQPKFNKTDLKAISIPLPPISEQKRIVEVLLIVDSAILKVDEVIAKTERLKKGLMQELLTKGIGHKEFKDDGFGRIPKDWEVVRLGNISSIKTGPFGSQLRKKELTSYGFKIYEQENVIHKDFNRGSDFISPEKFETLSNFEVLPDDILLTRVGSLGNAAEVPKTIMPGIIGSRLLRIRLSKNAAYPRYLAIVLMSSLLQHQVVQTAHGETRKGLNTMIVKSLKIPLPPFEEQQKIAKILSNVDKKLELEINEKSRLERIKLGLMDLLLTGKVRVKVG
jgi:type I restriction enzyme S subunit